ncbi:MAG: penicillin-binding protein 2 [Holosporaceae bacterium]|jgi:penicillin-binding protein 2|nr:penicillin-binding protein 2 [Holosporaceae bacterium]
MLASEKSQKDRKIRAKIIIFLVIVLSAILLIELYMLQVHFSEKYSLMSDKNRIRLSPVLPKRGRIITSDGKIVASSVHRYRLIMDYCNDKIFKENLTLLDRCLKLSEHDKQCIAEARKKARPHMSFVIKDKLSWDEYASISMDLFKFSNLSLETIYVRNYDMPLEFSHVIGHTGRSDDSIQILTGKTGIEAFLNGRLIGTIGNLQTEVNALGKKVRVTNFVEPKNGKDIKLTLDSKIQKYVYDIISEEKAGACVVLDILKGEVLAMASVPGFDVNLVSNKITSSQWKSIANDQLFPLINRAAICVYPPGSVFKIVVAFAALSEGVIAPGDRIFCSGGVKQDDRVFHCWNRNGHGSLDVCGALSWSCDCFFFEIARRLGIERIVKYAKKFGFGSQTGIELPNESYGLLPTKSWKFLRYGTSWKPYETMIVGIGQGALLSTLLQTAVMMGKIYANDYNFTPTMIRDNVKARTWHPIDPKPLETIKKALCQVCLYGTASRSCNTHYGISGKTGSSQVRKIKTEEAGVNQKKFDWKLRDHAFFVGCAPHNAPRYVVAVLIEHGGGGGAVAAPIARKVFDKLMEKQR